MPQNDPARPDPAVRPKNDGKNRQILVVFYGKNAIFENGHKNWQILVVNKPKI